MDIIKGDSVKLLSGRHKGAQGIVEKVFPSIGRVVVTGVNLRKRHLKRSRQNPKGGIAEFPAPLNRAILMIVCPHCAKPTRVGHTVGSDQRKYRQCRLCQGSLDSR